jgi:hypothetical protein
MSECLMTIMSATAQYSHRTGVEVSFVRDENKKEACFSKCLCRLLSLSRSRALSLARSLSGLSKSRLTSRRCSLALQVEADEPTEPRGESVFWTVDLCLATHFFAACLGFRG